MEQEGVWIMSESVVLPEYGDKGRLNMECAGRIRVLVEAASYIEEMYPKSGQHLAGEVRIAAEEMRDAVALATAANARVKLSIRMDQLQLAIDKRVKHSALRASEMPDVALVELRARLAGLAEALGYMTEEAR